MTTISNYVSEVELATKEKCEVCGKTCLSRRQAAYVINMAHRVHRGNQIPKRAYYCHYCNTFHVTHLFRKNRQEVKYRKIIKMPVRPYQVLLCYENSII